MTAMTGTSGLSDAAVARLKRLGQWPEFTSSRYSVQEEIGRGGMGTVYLATDVELGREVAIKVPNTLAHAEIERRLHTEARALATLEHPGIVPIHDVGRLADGRLFYVMKRVRGRTLREHLAALTDLTERLRIFERICEPVAFAHAQGFIHRDLTPDNVMVGAYGEVMVMDWGIVKVVSRESSVDSPQSAVSVGSRQSAARNATDYGVVIGTRGFMAPEQERGAVDDVDQRSDVYGLGALLFLLLTNEAPPTAGEREAKLRALGIPRALAAICAAAMAEAPADRYQSVTALAEDVARYRAGTAVGAYRESAIERIARFGRTYRTAILLILAYIVMRAVVAYVVGR
jgi:serine/threonine-protein kinase